MKTNYNLYDYICLKKKDNPGFNRRIDRSNM